MPAYMCRFALNTAQKRVLPSPTEEITALLQTPSWIKGEGMEGKGREGKRKGREWKGGCYPLLSDFLAMLMPSTEWFMPGRSTCDRIVTLNNIAQ